MIIGDSALSKSVLKKLFGTDNYENIKDNISVVNPEDENQNPYISYKAMTDPLNLGEFEDIPIADIGVRQDGKGYGPTIKHEMTMRKDFFERLRKINEEMDTNFTAEQMVGLFFNKLTLRD